MRTRYFWLTVLGLSLCLATPPHAQGWAGEAEKEGPAPTTEEQNAEAPQPTQEASVGESGGLVGTIVAVVPESRTLVVDVPLGAEVLRLGTGVTERTKITAEGAATSLERLKEGAEVRIQYHRVDNGDEATSVEVLHGPTG